MEVARALVITVLTLTSPGEYSPWQGTVVEIVRPYEIKVQRNDGTLASVRIYGIQSPCPESGQPHGKEAQLYTTRRLKGKVVKVQPLMGRIFLKDDAPRVRQEDTLYWDKNKQKYDRIIALVYVDEESFGEELLKSGMAWWFRPFVPWEHGYKRLEEEAREAKVGLWVNPDPTPPWKFHRTPITDGRDPSREWVHPWVRKDGSDVDGVDSGTIVPGTNIEPPPQLPIAENEKKPVEHAATEPAASEVSPQNIPDSLGTPTGAVKPSNDSSGGTIAPDPDTQTKQVSACHKLLRDLKTALTEKEPVSLAQLRERLQSPCRDCKKDTEAIGCFKCTIVGQLTDSIEVIEKDGVVTDFRFGGCGCSN
jgi:endonuclease YncB( thermonuclease family)